jgi:hypothetical protein
MFFDKKEIIFMWLTNGGRFSIKLTQFAQLLGLTSQLDIPKKLHSGRVMAPREMTSMYMPNCDFRAPKIDGILPHYLVLHKMVMKTLTPRNGYSKAIPVYERNLLDALMKHEKFDVFGYNMDEIWNITTNPLRSCGFAPYIQCMIEVVTHEKFYEDIAHDSLHPTVPKDMKTHHTASPLLVAPSHSTRSGGAFSSSSTNSGFLKMFQGIFSMCYHMD